MLARDRANDEVLIGAVRARLVAECRPPEGHYIGDDRGARNDQQGLDRGRVGGHALLARHGGDLPGQLDVTLAHPVVVVGDRDEAHGHACGSDVDVGRVASVIGRLGDRPYELGTRRERFGAEERTGTLGKYPPVLDALGLVEVARRDRLRGVRHQVSPSPVRARSICRTCVRSCFTTRVLSSSSRCTENARDAFKWPLRVAERYLEGPVSPAFSG